MAIDLGDIPTGTPPTAGEKLQIRSAIGVGTTDAPTFLAQTLTGQSLTGTQATSLVDLNATWNTSGTPTAIKLNVVETGINSNAASKLMDLQVGGVSQFRVNKTGQGFLLGKNDFSPDIMFGSNGTVGLGQYINSTFFIRINSDTPIFINGGQKTVQIGAGHSFGFTIDPGGATAGLGTALFQDAAGILAQRNGAAKQVHRVYNTFLGTTANEWGGFDWLTTTNVLRIGTDHAGTGGARDLQIITNGIARLTIQGNGNASFTNTVGFGGNVNVGYLLGLASLLVSQLPAASGTAIFSLVGVSNSTVTAAAGKGTTVVGGGSNKVIVMCDGTNWVIL